MTGVHGRPTEENREVHSLIEVALTAGRGILISLACLAIIAAGTLFQIGVHSLVP